MENPTKKKVLVIEVDFVSKELKKFLEQNFAEDEVVILENAGNDREKLMELFFGGGFTDIVFQSVFSGTSKNILSALLRGLAIHSPGGYLVIHSLSDKYLTQALNQLQDFKYEPGLLVLQAIKAVSVHKVWEYDFFGDWQKHRVGFQANAATFTHLFGEKKDPRHPWPRT